jgi:hypothetical protein
MRYLSSLIITVLFFCGCSQQSSLRRSELRQGQTVELTMNTGKSVQGDIAKIEDDALVIKDSDGQAWRAKDEAIIAIQGPEPVLDLKGNVISESEIQSRKGSKNTMLFTLSGAGLTLGASFFLSSMISRADEENRDPIIYGGTAAGTALGTYLFYRMGKRKDREAAIEEIRLSRGGLGESLIEQERQRKQELEKEIERLKKQVQEKENKN